MKLEAVQLFLDTDKLYVPELAIDAFNINGLGRFELNEGPVQL